VESIRKDQAETRLTTWAEGSPASLRVKNALCSVVLVFAAVGAYCIAPFQFHRQQTRTLFGSPELAISGGDFLVAAAIVYSIGLAAWFLTRQAPEVSKSLRFFRVLSRFARSPSVVVREGLSAEERLAVLSTLLKGFFGPLMALLLMRMCLGALVDAAGIRELGLSGGLLAVFNRYGYWFVFQLIIFIDVSVFTVGYLVESRRLGNQIRSVDPTIVGWGAALLCYPPFNSVTAVIIGSPASEFPQFADPTLHVVMNLLVLVLMVGFASASVALGFKASNLTHRGIVARGPYALVRHPAYVCKNVAWWIGSVPAVDAAFANSTFAGVQVGISVVAVTALYVLRALTEEDHLRSVDGEYDAYAAKVRYRFIPGLA
jgi:protein-S-isoprenylcysteine O-methyltransferase Ste14